MKKKSMQGFLLLASPDSESGQRNFAEVRFRARRPKDSRLSRGFPLQDQSLFGLREADAVTQR